MDLVERQAIVDVLVQGMHSLDRGDRAGFADCWSENVDFEVRMFDGHAAAAQSRDQLVAMVASSLEGKPSPLRHVVGPIEVRFTAPDTAEAFFYATYFGVGSDPKFAGMGEYHNWLVKDSDGKWRVSKRRHQFLTPLGH